MNEIDPDTRSLIARHVTLKRDEYGWTKTAAARRAGVSTITWTRVEDGLRVRSDRLAAVLAAVNLRRPDVEPAPTTDVAELLAHDPTLSTASRDHIVNQYRILQRLSALEVGNDADQPDPDEQAILDSDLNEEQRGEALGRLRQRRRGDGGPSAASAAAQ